MQCNATHVMSKCRHEFFSFQKNCTMLGGHLFLPYRRIYSIVAHSSKLILNKMQIIFLRDRVFDCQHTVSHMPSFRMQNGRMCTIVRADVFFLLGWKLRVERVPGHVKEKSSPSCKFCSSTLDGISGPFNTRFCGF